MVVGASSVFRENLVRILGASWGPPLGSSHDGGGAAGDGDRGDDSVRADRMACTSPGWPPTGTRDYWPRVPPP